jgi:hypothetical protein
MSSHASPFTSPILRDIRTVPSADFIGSHIADGDSAKLSFWNRYRTSAAIWRLALLCLLRGEKAMETGRFLSVLANHISKRKHTDRCKRFRVPIFNPPKSKEYKQLFKRFNDAEHRGMDTSAICDGIRSDIALLGMLIDSIDDLKVPRAHCSRVIPAEFDEELFRKLSSRGGHRVNGKNAPYVQESFAEGSYAAGVAAEVQRREEVQKVNRVEGFLPSLAGRRGGMDEVERDVRTLA